MNPIETIEAGPNRVYLYQDEYPSDPRKDYDHLGVMVCLHRRYDLGDRQKLTGGEEAALEHGGWDALVKHLTRRGAVCVLELGLIDHSGLSMYVGGGSHWSDSGGWDSGTVGFIYATRARCDELGVDPDLEVETTIKLGPIAIACSPTTMRNVEAQLRAEVSEYDSYLRGDVYGYEVVNDEGLVLDSCWGFYGYDYALEEAKRAAGLPVPA